MGRGDDASLRTETSTMAQFFLIYAATVSAFPASDPRHLAITTETFEGDENAALRRMDAICLDVGMAMVSFDVEDAEGKPIASWAMPVPAGATISLTL